MNKTLKAKDYRKIFFLYGVVYATIPIIIAELIWDSLANADIIGGFLLVVTILFGIIYIIVSIIKIRKVLKI